jgi:hypothetical protein
MREAERLDAAYADLKARNVPDAERVREAAAQHRTMAEELRADAEAFDAPVPSPQDQPTPAGVRMPPRTEEERLERGPFGATEPPTDGDLAAVDPLGAGPDGALLAASPTEPAGDDVDIEMPPDDISRDADFADASTEVGLAEDPLTGDPMADVATEPDSSFADAADAAGAPMDDQLGDDSDTEGFDT